MNAKDFMKTISTAVESFAEKVGVKVEDVGLGRG